ncbi:hypothetical protein VPH35_034282 [Triticum aestivum]
MDPLVDTVGAPLDVQPGGPADLVADTNVDVPDSGVDTGTGDGGELLLRDFAATGNEGVFPLKVLCDILLRLPARTICRFRCVCTSWRSLLFHPGFVAAYRRRSFRL